MPNERKKERAEARKEYHIVTREEAKKYKGYIVPNIDDSTDLLYFIDSYAGGGEIPTSWKVKLKHKENNKAENITLSNSNLDEGDETITTEKDARYYALKEVQRPYDWEVVSVIPVYEEGGKLESESWLSFLNW